MITAADTLLLRAAQQLADLAASDVDGDTKEAVAAGQALTSALAAGANPDTRAENRFRAVDILVRGRDSMAAAEAIDALVGAGAEVQAGPLPQEAPPLHTACYRGAWRATTILLGVGVPPDSLATAPSQKLIRATPLIAMALGFRGSHIVDYHECFRALIDAGADPELRDGQRRSAADIATRMAASTNDRALMETFYKLGVDLDGAGRAVSASAVAKAMVRDADETTRLSLQSLTLRSKLKAALRNDPKP